MRRRRRRAGMTMIEILVVLMIMTAIASAVSLGVMKHMEDARKRDTQTRARTLQSAVVAFLMETPGPCPDVDDLVRSDIIDKTTDHRDGWGHDFTFECEGSTVHVRSSGKDGQFGSEDDVGF